MLYFEAKITLIRPSLSIHNWKLLIMLFNSLFFTFIIPCGKSLVKAGGGSLLKSRGNVAVKVKGC